MVDVKKMICLYVTTGFVYEHDYWISHVLEWQAGVDVEWGCIGLEILYKSVRWESSQVMTIYPFTARDLHVLSNNPTAINKCCRETNHWQLLFLVIFHITIMKWCSIMVNSWVPNNHTLLDSIASIYSGIWQVSEWMSQSIWIVDDLILTYFKRTRPAVGVGSQACGNNCSYS